jgi:hypothetical protein
MGSSFAAIIEVANLMRGFKGPWFVSGGWAIDLFLEKETRQHADIEIGIYRRDQQELWRHLPDWNFEKAIRTSQGGEWIAWREGEELILPIHQIKATCSHAVCKEFEFFLNEHTGTHWISRRHPGLMRAADGVAMISFLDIPILSPEIQLLFKAKQIRSKDQADFELSIPRLNPARIQWLAAALQEYHPEHPWLQSLAPNQPAPPPR